MTTAPNPGQPTDALLPCPFCGAAADLPIGSERRSFGPGQAHVVCECGAMSPGGETVADAISSWNQRATKASASDAGWMPIDTVPKKGVFLVSLPIAGTPREGDRRVYEARWDETQQTITSANGFLLFDGATHWRPLPQPAESVQAQQAPSDLGNGMDPLGDSNQSADRVLLAREMYDRLHTTGKEAK